MTLKRILLFLTLTLLTAPLVRGQAAQSPKTYTGSLGGGIALTGGNTDTKNFNLTLGLVRDPRTRNVIKANAVYLRGTENDVIDLDRSAFNVRDEYTISGRAFVFGEVDYLRDKFEEIIFLWAPLGGVGYRLLNTDSTKFAIDGGVGGVFERNPGRTVSESRSLTAGERFQQELSSTATLTESLSTIWKTKDFADSLTTFSVGLTAAVAKQLEVKFEFIDTDKNKPASARVKKNDTAFVTTFVVKF